MPVVKDSYDCDEGCWDWFLRGFRIFFYPFGIAIKSGIPSFEINSDWCPGLWEKYRANYI